MSLSTPTFRPSTTTTSTTTSTTSPPPPSSTSSLSAIFQVKVAKSLAQVLTQPIFELDMRVVAVQASQAELLKEIDRLTADLQKFLSAIDPPPLEPIISKLNVTRKRLMIVNATLKNVVDRLDRIFLMAATAQQQQQSLRP
ncbi:hypothetical protein HDU76_002289 [Blyttiomyces sp. JEL0837]|nr:hypothetical protein HDU76_002289 [Blyttiomyces sp. JEL0837]